MPRSAPPPRTRHGSLRAVGSPRPLPVNPGGATCGPPPPSGMGVGRPLVPAASAGAPALVSRSLERGRLTCSPLVKATGWAPGTPLRADLRGPGLVMLRADDRASEAAPTAGSSRAHVDAKSALVVPEGLRAFLGVTPNGAVVARRISAPDGTPAIEVVAAVVTALLDASPPAVLTKQADTLTARSS